MSGTMFIAKLFILAALVATILATAGGGLAVPPFKSTPWIQTNATKVGIYGACPTTTTGVFFALDSNWAGIQASCHTLFSSLAADPLVGERAFGPNSLAWLDRQTSRANSRARTRTVFVSNNTVSRIDSIAVSAAHLLSLCLILLAITWPSPQTRRQASKVPYMLFAAFAVQLAGFGLAVARFMAIVQSLRDAGQPVEIGLGMWLSGAALPTLVLGGSLAWAGGYAAARRKNTRWDP
ncbi:hypothetical protein HK105_202646 [Polyrhizophydium stewartii]|uniref:Uncharacterized protein n=1 Tax=Polyrhizophydium stewartii TaxID=2732419 RepID=A0ABR4NE15_9FUNG|nr:hypothetical protein HK105_000778 [Polyrhizophydium stewartii]